MKIQKSIRSSLASKEVSLKGSTQWWWVFQKILGKLLEAKKGVFFFFYQSTMPSPTALKRSLVLGSIGMTCRQSGSFSRALFIQLTKAYFSSSASKWLKWLICKVKIWYKQNHIHTWLLDSHAQKRHCEVHQVHYPIISPLLIIKNLRWFGK